MNIRVRAPGCSPRKYLFDLLCAATWSMFLAGDVPISQLGSKYVEQRPVFPSPRVDRPTLGSNTGFAGNATASYLCNDTFALERKFPLSLFLSFLLPGGALESMNGERLVLTRMDPRIIWTIAAFSSQLSLAPALSNRASRGRQTTSAAISLQVFAITKGYSSSPR